MGLIYGLVVGFDGCYLLVDAVLERKEEEEKEENMLGIIRQKVSVRSSALLVLWFVLFMKFRGVSTYFSIYFLQAFGMSLQTIRPAASVWRGYSSAAKEVGGCPLAFRHLFHLIS